MNESGSTRKDNRTSIGRWRGDWRNGCCERNRQLGTIVPSLERLCGAHRYTFGIKHLDGAETSASDFPSAAIHISSNGKRKLDFLILVEFLHGESARQAQQRLIIYFVEERLIGIKKSNKHQRGNQSNDDYCDVCASTLFMHMKKYSIWKLKSRLHVGFDFLANYELI